MASLWYDFGDFGSKSWLATSWESTKPHETGFDEFWSNYSDLTRPGPPKGSVLEGKSPYFTKTQVGEILSFGSMNPLHQGVKLKKRPPAGHCMPFACQEKERRLCFLQFLSGLLRLNPDLRWTPKQAIRFFATSMWWRKSIPPPKKGYRKICHEFQVAEICHKRKLINKLI